MAFSINRRILVFALLLGLSGLASAEFCTKYALCRQECVIDWPFFLEWFGLKPFTVKCMKPCTKKVCCPGYTGTNCTERTDACTQSGLCLGHVCTEKYTEGCLCSKEETMTETFMGSNKRKVRVQCDTPCERNVCCGGFRGPDCNEKIPLVVKTSTGSNGDFLTEAQLESIKEQLKVDEGYRDEIYLDTEGLKTFGIGHLILESDPEHGKPVKTKVSEERIDEAFRADLHTAVTDVTMVFPNANSFPGEVKEILVNMMFNLGRTRLKKFKKFIAALNERDWDKAADEMVDSKWYIQVKSRGVRLVERMRAVPKGIKV